MPSPIDRMQRHVTDDSYKDVADAQDIPEGSSVSVELAGHDILICHTKGDFFAVENQCSHALSSLEGGRLRAYRLICPLHGAAFDVRDGCVKGKPASEPIRSYPLRVVEGRIQVSVEQD